MKKIYSVLVFLIVSVSLFAQGSKVEITNLKFNIWGDEAICSNVIQLDVNFTDGSFEQIFYEDEKGVPSPFGGFYWDDGDYFYDDITVYYTNKVIRSIRARVNTHEKRDGRRCSSGTGSFISQDSQEDGPIIISYDPCDFGFYDEFRRNGGEKEVEHTLSFNWRVSPTPVVSRIGSGIAGYSHNLRAIANGNFNDSVYGWEYQITDFGSTPNASSWNTIPGASNDKELSVRLDSFLPVSVVGKSIHVRVKSCFYAEPSDSRDYLIRYSAPNIIKAQTATTDVSCYDNEDGVLVLTFDRALDRSRDLFDYSILDLSEGIVIATAQVPITTFETGNRLTITGLPPSKTAFRFNILGSYNGEVYFTEGVDHTDEFSIGRNDYVRFIGEPQDNVVNVWCHNGEDGEINLEAYGGIGNYEYLIKKKEDVWSDDWQPFDNGTNHTIRGQKKGTYLIKIRDVNNGVFCVAKKATMGADGETVLGIEVEKEVTITEPEFPVSVEVNLVNEPRAYDFEDGRIQATIRGGTAYADGSYIFEWVDKSLNPVTTTSTSYNDDGDFVVALHSIGQGEYTIIVKDANFDSAITEEGCTTTSASYTLNHPEPITVRIEVLNEISCHRDNSYSNGIDDQLPFNEPDQFQDGVLVAYVSGGVSFAETLAENDECRANFMPYCYRWTKNVAGVWQDLAINDSIISNQSEGTYALNIEDQNGIVLGTYLPVSTPTGQEYVLEQAIDSTLYLAQPDQLLVSFNSTAVTCDSGANGSATAIVSGGTPPYTYQWNTSATTAEITDLLAGKYTVEIIDAKGCEVKGTITINQPNGLEIEAVTYIAPTCFQGNDGQIELAIQGGVPPYSLAWDTGDTSATLTALTAGIYSVEVTDAQGCKAVKEFILNDPDPIVVILEEKRAICGDQSLLLDITINDPGATYEWSSVNGFTSRNSKVEITEAGQYTATITSSLGCIGTGTIDVDVFTTPIDADFLLTTQAYTNEEVILVNVSAPMGERVVWTIPEGATLVSESDEQLILMFEKEGPYDVLLTSLQGDCYEEYVKTILVQPAIETAAINISSSNFIEEFIVYPNPASASFKAKVTLAEDANVTLKIVNLVTGVTMNEQTGDGNREYLMEYTMQLPTGIYLMMLETIQGTDTRKLVIE
ncbi:hypothetical protein GCM10022393_09580 [Aquimarina addita]|uniref:Secretion system C-terminal sorting domain-containing protein n=1 Tax=Aquimarina addita TaxID=870485 RepID=A0ABP7XCQ8_9FLAO